MLEYPLGRRKASWIEGEKTIHRVVWPWNRDTGKWWHLHSWSSAALHWK